MSNATITAHCPVCDTHEYRIAITRQGEQVDFLVPEYCPSCRLWFSVEDMHDLRLDVLYQVREQEAEDAARYSAPPKPLWMQAGRAA